MNSLTPIPFKIAKSEKRAFMTQVDQGPHFYSQLHYHPEYQITAIIKGEGILYAGNDMTLFSEGDVFMFGTNAPHMLKCSKLYHMEKSPGVHSVSLFFTQSSFGVEFFKLRELSGIGQLLQDANRVIRIIGKQKDDIFTKIITATSLKKEQAIIRFLEILSLIRRTDKEFINTEKYDLVLNNNEGGRLNDVLDYTFKHFHQEIKIDQIAKTAALSRSQFSYFFKLHTGKTYIQFLNEVRIENACILLKNENNTVEQICYESGFQNVSNFVRHFKKVKGETPSQFRKSWQVT